MTVIQSKNITFSTSQVPSQTLTMASDGPSNVIDPSIFEYLKSHGEEEIEVGDKLHQITSALNRHISTCQGFLSRIHSTPSSKRAYREP